MAKKKKFQGVVTPVGIAKFPWITAPDVEHNKDGVFHTNLLLNPDEKSTKELVKTIDSVIEAHVTSLKEAKVFKKSTKINYPYKEDEDKEGNETGLLAIKFKRNQTITKQTGEIVKVKVPIVDKNGKVVKNPPPIYGGSKIAIRADLVPYPREGDKPGSIGVGVSLRIVAVQLIEPAEYERDYGFEQHDDGYEAESNPFDGVQGEDGTDGAPDF